MKKIKKAILFLLICLMNGTLLWASEPQSAMQDLLTAMQKGDVEKISSLSTPKGYGALEALKPERYATDDFFSLLGDRWARDWEDENNVHWSDIRDKQVIVHMGPKMNQGQFLLIETDEGWKVDDFIRGE